MCAMKKILFIIVLFIPLFCLGQGKVADENPQSKLEKILKNLKEGEEPLYVIDGIPSENTEILDMDSVADISYLKNELVKMVFGEKAKDGIIIVTTKKTKQETKNSHNKSGIGQPISLNVDKILEGINLRKIEKPISSAKIVDVNLPAKMTRNIFIVDGYILEEEEIMSLKVENIESISVLRSYPPGFDSRYNYVEVTMKNGVEYEAMVLDAGFDSFLATQKSKDYYSIASLKAKNEYLVTEWNYRCSLPSVYNPNVYEQKIDYESRLDYGLDVEYTVYMFFKFMVEQNNIRFDTTFI